MNHPVSHQLQALHSAVNSNDTQALKALYRDDAVLIEKPMMTSRTELLKALDGFKSKYMPAHVVSQGDDVVVEAGDTALVISKLYVSAKQSADTTEGHVKKAIYVFRKNTDGQWQCAIDNFFGVDLIDFA